MIQIKLRLSHTMEPMSETQLLLCEVTSVISNDEILLLVFGEKSSRETEVLVKETSDSWQSFMRCAKT